MSKRLFGLMVVSLLVGLLVGCSAEPTPTVSPIVTPTFPPSPLVAEEGGRPQGSPVLEVEEVSEMEQVTEIGGVEIVFLVMGIAALIKTFGLRGKRLLAFAVVLGALVNGVALAVSGGLVPEAMAAWVVLAVRAVGYTLAIPGLYDLLKEEMLPAVSRMVADPFSGRGTYPPSNKRD